VEGRAGRAGEPEKTARDRIGATPGQLDRANPIVDPGREGAMTTIRQILARKPEVYAIGPEAIVLDALRLLEEKNVGALLVLKGPSLVGIFSERDYARRMVLHGRSSKETTVREVMTTEVFTIAPEATAGECMVHMTDRHIRHLPVLEAGRVVGVISIGDVVRAVIEDMRFTIRQLEGYIRSGG
jgi:CBS domain-containing protein